MRAMSPKDFIVHPVKGYYRRLQMHQDRMLSISAIAWGLLYPAWLAQPLRK